MGMVMLAFVYEGAGKLGLKEVPAPRIKKNSAVIAVEASSICGTDLRAYRFGSAKILPPRIMGHEVVGTITEIGGDITAFKTGDRIQLTPALGCGVCYYCTHGRRNMCDSPRPMGFVYDGSFAEYMELPAEAFEQDHVTRVPDHVPSVEAVLAEPVACIVNAQSFLHIEKGDAVAVFGSGFIGTMHAVLAYSQGASRVFMVDINDDRLASAKNIVPDLTLINSKKENVREAVMAYTDKRGVDVAITACSVGSAQADAMNIAAKRGRVSLFGGLPAESAGFIDSNIIHYREISVHGCHGSTNAQNRETLDMIASGKISVKPFTKNQFSLKDIEKAFEMINREQIVKAILVPGR
jgi:L-iditol 2-dehydrogenase